MDENVARTDRSRVCPALRASEPSKVAPGATWEEVGSAGRRKFGGRRRLGSQSTPRVSRRRRGWRRGWLLEEKWQSARPILEKLKALYPEYVGPDNPYLLLATVFRRLSDQVAEQKVLEELAMRDGDSIGGLPAIDGAG